MTFLANQFLASLLIFSVTCRTSDPHESMSRRTPSGIPYYLTNRNFHDVFYTTSGLLVLEFATNSSGNNTSWVKQYIPGKTHKSNIITGKTFIRRDEIYSSVLDNCQLGDLFQGFYLSEEEKLQFLQRLDSSCFRGKWELKVDNLTYNRDKDQDGFWMQVLNDCKSKKIPDSLVAPDKLFSFVDHFQKESLQLENLQISLPLTELSVYYQLELASCAFSVNSFIVAIQVPVDSIPQEDGSSDYQDYSLIPIPLWMPHDAAMICRLEDRSSNFSPDLEGVYHYNFKTGELVPEANLLCHALGEPICFFPNPKLTQRPMKKSCVQAIIESMDEDIVCDMKCEPAAAYSLPVIRKVATDRFMIVADLTSNEEIRIECPPFQKEEALVFPVTGTLEVILPCDCHIRYRKTTFNSTIPCGSEFSKIPINFPGNYDDNRDVSIELQNK